MPDDDLLQAVARLSNAQWSIGDIGLERIGQLRPDEARDEILTMAGITKLSPKTVRRYVSVSLAFPPAVRRADVPWSIHRVFAAQPNRRALVSRAAREGWSYDRAVAAVQIAPPPKLPFDIAIEALEAAHDRVLITLAALRSVGPLPELERDLLQRAIERAVLPLDWCRSFLSQDGSTWEEGLEQILEGGR